MLREGTDSGAVPPLRVAVIIGSTREGRLGATAGHWFARRAGLRGDLGLSVIDLAGYDFPARYPERATDPMRDFSERIDKAEAFVVVTPEYNRSFPASLKQAIDYAYDEWHAKPVGFVSYGHGSRGLYAVEQLRTVFTELHTVTLRNGVALDLLEEGWADGERAAQRMLGQLAWWGLALREARAARPYLS
ncbi:NADPH-dependent FMN reductase [Streptomyces yaizuensis]|uniref:NAD(P)H-dependent oxidoreductase n=1 Tax=Streptomyces yaizuensis TaxID=2989713 RepID=A0ABQ5P0R7_9ACTN|nr:NAD(P)H-dependent oxidoreductase [Streptomyces sp. YSPA8]GLF95811.1 NAD(P)H-dependent oxidoreductase [Streptomyces sp. YSPA8]